MLIRVKGVEYPAYNGFGDIFQETSVFNPCAQKSGGSGAYENVVISFLITLGVFHYSSASELG